MCKISSDVTGNDFIHLEPSHNHEPTPGKGKVERAIIKLVNRRISDGRGFDGVEAMFDKLAFFDKKQLMEIKFRPTSYIGTSFCSLHSLQQWYSTGDTRRHPRGYVKYLCSFIIFYMMGNNIFVI
jgi:hypothetical protein